MLICIVPYHIKYYSLYTNGCWLRPVTWSAVVTGSCPAEQPQPQQPEPQQPEQPEPEQPEPKQPQGVSSLRVLADGCFLCAERRRREENGSQRLSSCSSSGSGASGGGASGGGASGPPPRLVPGHRLWASRHGPHVLGLIQDHHALCKQISEGRRLTQRMDVQLQEGPPHHRVGGALGGGGFLRPFAALTATPC